jgi:hypothetical protein
VTIAEFPKAGDPPSGVGIIGRIMSRNTGVYGPGVLIFMAEEVASRSFKPAGESGHA